MPPDIKTQLENLSSNITRKKGEKFKLDGVELTIEVFKLASQITKNSSKEFVEKVLTTYLQLAIHYNFSPEDLNTHYVKKNEINYQRIKDNY